LEADPLHHGNIKPLGGPFAGLRRFRVGDWRVVYRIGERDHVVYVVDIAHRSEVYG
jgi:mRNA interferase RelE/StbE